MNNINIKIKKISCFSSHSISIEITCRYYNFFRPPPYLDPIRLFIIVIFISRCNSHNILISRHKQNTFIAHSMTTKVYKWLGIFVKKKIDEQKVLTHRLLMPNTTVRSGNVSFNDAQIKRTLVKKRKFLLKFVNRAFLFALDRKTI